MSFGVFESDRDIEKLDNDSKKVVLDAQELERQRIARDLHDSTVQTLTGMVHKLELCCRLLESDPVRCHLELKVMGNNLRNSISEIRDIIYDLRPMSFDDIGLEVAIEELIRRTQSKSVSDANINLKISCDLSIISNTIAFSILHLIEEGCNNALKYSGCSKIDIGLDFTDNNEVLKLSICDDGKGFDLEKLSVNKSFNSGFGIPIMRERVYFLNGTCDIRSSLGKGTDILILIPLK